MKLKHKCPGEDMGIVPRYRSPSTGPSTCGSLSGYKGVMWHVLVIVFLALFSSGNAVLSVGDRCTNQNRLAGVCVRAPDCQPRSDILSGIRPTLCGFDFNTPIICCSKAEGNPAQSPSRPQQPPQSRPQNPFPPQSRPQNPFPPQSRPQNPSPPQSRPQNPSPPQSRPQNPSPPQSRPQSSTSNSFKSVSERMCDEYSKVVSENVNALALGLDSKPVSFSLESCPLSGVELIVGGEAAKVGEFPHMAAIGFRQPGSNGYDWDCAGSLISDRFVLTAGHCTTSFKGPPVVVRLGVLNLGRDDSSASSFRPPGSFNSPSSGDYMVDNIIRHPAYRPPAKYNDIALLKLRNPVTPFTKILRPACLYREPSFSFSRAVASGWGKLGNDDDQSDTLMKVSLDILDADTCNRLYATDRNTNRLREGIVPSMMCAGYLQGGKDTCQGDSGGPIQIRGNANRCVYYVLGLTSFGKICGIENSAAVYTRVSYFLPWLEQNVWPSG